MYLRTWFIVSLICFLQEDSCRDGVLLFLTVNWKRNCARTWKEVLAFPLGRTYWVWLCSSHMTQDRLTTRPPIQRPRSWLTNQSCDASSDLAHSSLASCSLWICVCCLVESVSHGCDLITSVKIFSSFPGIFDFIFGNAVWEVKRFGWLFKRWRGRFPFCKIVGRLYPWKGLQNWTWRWIHSLREKRMHLANSNIVRTS